MGWDVSTGFWGVVAGFLVEFGGFGVGNWWVEFGVVNWGGGFGVGNRFGGFPKVNCGKVVWGV